MTLRLLTDESVNGQVARAIGERHDAVTVLESGLSGHSDFDVAQRSRELDRIVVTEDRGFARNVLGTVHPGVIVLELADHPVAEQINRVIAALGDDAQHLSGRVTIIRIDGVRQRTL